MSCISSAFYIHSDLDCLGVLCHVDLFLVPERSQHSASELPIQTVDQNDSILDSLDLAAPLPFANDPSLESSSHCSSDSSTVWSTDIHPSPGAEQLHLQSSQFFHSQPVHFHGDFAIYEEAKRTDALAGSLYTQVSVANYQQRSAWMCVFSVSFSLHVNCGLRISAVHVVR